MTPDELTLRDLRLDAYTERISMHSKPSREEESTPPTNLINTPVSDINMKDLALEEQLQKISRNTIKEVWGWKPTKIKSDVTEAMIRDYQDELQAKPYVDPITGQKFRYHPAGTDVDLEEVPPPIPFLDDRIRQLREERVRLSDMHAYFLTEIERIRNQIGEIYHSPSPDVRKMKELEHEIKLLKSTVEGAEGRIEHITRLIETDERDAADNEAERVEITKSNRDLLRKKSEELMLLNRGHLNLVLQPGESNEEFTQRLIEVGQAEYDDQSVQDAAERRQLQKFKDNMKEITRNSILVENIIKSSPPEMLYNYNQYWSTIKTEYVKVYGKAIFKEDDYDKIIQIFNNIIDKNQLLHKPAAFEGQAAFEEPQKQSFNPLWVEQRTLLGSDPNNAWRMKASDLKIKYGADYKHAYGKKIGSAGSKERILEQLYNANIISAPDEFIEPPAFPQLSGTGLPKELPKLKALGKIAINPYQLFYRNTLIISTHKGTHLVGYKNRIVSDAFVHILMKLLEGHHPTHHEISQLDLREKQIYDNLIHLAHLHKTVENDIGHTREAMKKRFELLTGEIQAGNTNRALKTELKELLHQMAHGGMISHPQAYQFIRSL